jgi:DNA-binding MarR family transcriptional regulator
LTQLNAVAIKLKQRARTVDGFPGELPVAEHAVLDIIHRAGALTVPQIARERSTSRQNIQILVDRLAREGQVELVGNPAHKRSALVRLTEQGRTWLATGEQSQRQFFSEIESRLSQGEIRAAVSVLRKVQSLLNGEGRQQNHNSQPRRSNRPVSASEPEKNSEEFPVNLL